MEKADMNEKDWIYSVNIDTYGKMATQTLPNNSSSGSRKDRENGNFPGFLKVELNPADMENHSSTLRRDVYIDGGSTSAWWKTELVRSGTIRKGGQVAIFSRLRHQEFDGI